LNITVNIEAPGLVEAINKFATTIAHMRDLRHEIVGEQIAVPAGVKAMKSKQKLAPIPEPVVVLEVAAVAPRTIDEVKTLAALKAKKVGAAVIKGLIADTGSTQIADIADPHVLASLAANLDAL
jgi:hypothetical protein